jgi:hypothetical protein
MYEIFAVSDFQEFVTSAFDFMVKLATLSAPLILSYLAYKAEMARLEAVKVKKVLAEVTEGVKETAKEQSGQMSKVLAGNEIIHTLVNHERHVLLSTIAVGARTLYDYTKRDEHRLIAEQAEAALKAHDAGQHISDTKDVPVKKV